MKFILIAALPAVAAFGQTKALNLLYDKANVKSTQTRFLQRQEQIVRKLDTCDFFTSLQLNCSLEEFCNILNEGDDVSTYECGGDVEGSGEFYYKVVDPLMCYDTFDSQNGTAVADGVSTEGAAYCSKTTGYFNFTGDLLTVSDLIEEITAPDALKGTLRMVLPISACSTDESDFFVNQPYCIGECPTVLEINGVECASACVECDDGSQLPSCGNIDESLAGECGSPEWSDDDFTQEFLAFFNKTNTEPTSSATHSSFVYCSVVCVSTFLSILALF